MTAPGFDADFLAACRAAQLVTHQELFLQTVMRRIDPNSLLGHHSSVSRGLSLDIPQALSAIESHRSRAQPHPAAVHALCQSAAAAAHQALADSRSTIASDVKKAISHVQLVKSGKTKVLNDSDLVAAHTGLQAVETRLPAYLKDVFTRIWDHPDGSDATLAAYGADEIAAAAAMNDRDRPTLEQDLTRLFRTTTWTTADVFSVLLPPRRPFKHASVVLGASELIDLHRLVPSAVHLTGRAKSRPAWGPATETLRNWLEGLSIVGDGVVISFDVDACDRASAARRGQQAATELLDHYMAGHRVSVMELSPNAFTCESGLARGAHMNAPVRSVSAAKPLVDRWPEQMRSTMRMAHLSRTSGAPLVSAALAWSAIEAAGLKPADKTAIARVLALQTVRHQVAAAHVGLLNDVRARRKYWQSQWRANREAAARNDRLLAKLGAGHPGRKSVEALRADHLEATNRAARELASVAKNDDALATLEAYCLTKQYAALRDFNSWVDVLLPGHATDSDHLRDARAAVDTATLGASAVTREAVQTWRLRFASPKRLATWLTETESLFERLLTSMYASRNMTMHSGVFMTPGDIVLGRGAELVADMLMEVLGNWYRHSRAADSRDLEAPTVIVKDLANRFVKLCLTLQKSNQPAYELNVAWLTGPGSPDGWDRPPR